MLISLKSFLSSTETCQSLISMSLVLPQIPHKPQLTHANKLYYKHMKTTLKFLECGKRTRYIFFIVFQAWMSLFLPFSFPVKCLWLQLFLFLVSTTTTITTYHMSIWKSLFLVFLFLFSFIFIGFYKYASAADKQTNTI